MSLTFHTTRSNCSLRWHYCSTPAVWCSPSSSSWSASFWGWPWSRRSCGCCCKRGSTLLSNEDIAYVAARILYCLMATAVFAGVLLLMMRFL
jgi:hypothetical protein